MRLATWNVNSLAVRLPQVLDWLAANPVDALVLQETKLTDDKFPRAEIEAAGYAVHFHGQKTYNGVALLSRQASVGDALQVVKNIPGFDDEQARVIAGTVGGVRAIGGYFPNGQAPDSDKFVYKMRWLDALHVAGRAARQQGDAVIGFLAEPLRAITRSLDLGVRKLVVGELGLLQHDGIDWVLGQPGEQLRQAHGQRIDVPGGEFHGGLRSRVSPAS